MRLYEGLYLLLPLYWATDWTFVPCPDNLAANFSRELADYIIYVIDVAGGDKVPRKGGPGITQADLLVINKIDLAPHVHADLSVMDRDAKLMRGTGPTVFSQINADKGVAEIVACILRAFDAK